MCDSNNEKPTLLLTNDDGYDAPGIRCLYRALTPFFRISVVAPATQQSGIGHAFTYHSPLFYSHKKTEEYRACAVEGTPADCVKLAVSHLLPEAADVIVSGMNIGENSGVCGYYSGTVAAAREGAFWRIPSFAFSLPDRSVEYLEEYCRLAARMLSDLAAQDPTGVPGRAGIYYNVNFPECPPAGCRGIRVTRQSRAFFNDRYRAEPQKDGRTGYFIYGEKVDVEESDEYDSRAILNKYVAITPLDFDATARGSFNELQCLQQFGLPVETMK